MNFINQRFIRKAHRYLGLFIGIQFLGWTISGLYFSWNNIDAVHGDHLRKQAPAIETSANMVSPMIAIDSLRAHLTVDSIYSIRIINLLNKPVYQIGFFSGHAGDGHHPHIHYALAEAISGKIRSDLTREEGIALAKEHLVEGAVVAAVHYLEATSAHHEYRSGDLPAWEVVFKNPDCTAYISADQGVFKTIRHNQWRVFDFLWMFHTMDFAGRDNFNNMLLRIFSIFALITVVSGFALFVVSSAGFRKAKR